MAFSVEDFRDLLRLLEEHPEWREELRARLLTQELLELPAVVRDLAQSVRELAQRIEALETQVGHLAAQVGQLVAQMSELGGRVADHSGRLLEMDYARKGPSFFARIARRLRLVDPGLLAARLDDARREARLTEDELDAVMAADIVLEGRRRSDDEEVYLLVDVSWGVGSGDIQRARERSELLAKLGKPVIPVVAGKWMDATLVSTAESLGVWRVLNGTTVPPPDRRSGSP